MDAYEMDAYEMALRRIAEARATNASVLGLDDLNFESLPPELGDLKALRVLVLGTWECRRVNGKLTWGDCGHRSAQRLTDATARFSIFPKFDHLTWYDGIKDLSPLASLHGLQSLGLGGCRGITDLSPLESLPNLQTLGLAGCNGITDLSPLESLPNLQTLDLPWCPGIKDLSPLASLQGLQSLGLDGCEGITDLSPLASLPGLQALYLGWCNGITDLSPLASLPSLQSLDLTMCEGIKDLSPLASLHCLHTLGLGGCVGITDLSPLASLHGLQTLALDDCEGITDLSPLASLRGLHVLDLHNCSRIPLFKPLRLLLHRLHFLSLFGCRFTDIDTACCGESPDDNVIAPIRAHYHALASGVSDAAEFKVFVLGNATVGKTQLCNRLKGAEFNPDEKSTHGVVLDGIDLPLPGRDAPVRLNLWDFGGQEIYHSSHALFLHNPAIFLLLWTPGTEHGDYIEPEGHLKIRHHPLEYWLDYIRSLAGTDNPVLVLRGKCDIESDEQPLPAALLQRFSSLRCLQFSACLDDKVTGLRAALEQAACDLLARHPPPPIAEERVRVRRCLRKLQRRRRTLTWPAFRRLCDRYGPIDDPDELLKFFHRSCVVFWRPDAFAGRIILDQSWALDAIYTLFHRAKVLPAVFGKGRFTRELLAELVWESRSEIDQHIFLAMMETCGICFRHHRLNSAGKCPQQWEYIAPDLLPARDAPEVQHDLDGRIPSLPAPARAEIRYRFFHEGIMRRFLSWLGRYALSTAVYWKFGCWVYNPQSRSGVLVDSRWGDDPCNPRQGTVTVEAWGEPSRQLIEPLVLTLNQLSFAEKPEVIFTGIDTSHAPSDSADTPLVVEMAKQSIDDVRTYLCLQSLPPLLQEKISAIIRHRSGHVWLNTLCMVRRSGSSLKAAPKLGITNVAVGKHLENLHNTGPAVTLFNTNSKGTVLTPLGHQLCDCAERLAETLSIDKTSKTYTVRKP